MAKGGKTGGSTAARSASAATAQLQEDVWAQCDNPNCKKWRRLPPRTIIDENTPWYCYMNPDEEKSACEAPEESYKLDVELEPGYEKPEPKAASSSRHFAGKSRASSYADKGKSSSRNHQHSALQWQATQRSHSGGSSQGNKRRADSDGAMDPPYESKRARVSTPSAPRLHPHADASGHDGHAKAEADLGGALSSDLMGSSSGGLRHSLRPKRPPSYPLKEESPPPQGPPRQSGSRQGQSGSRPPSGQSQKAQAAAMRPTQKVVLEAQVPARKQHKGFEKLLALGGLWEIVKGKGKAITPAPFWVWEGLATHTPAAAELAAQAADVASAARYFEGGNHPSGASQAAEAASLKRQAMTAAAVLGLDATSQIPDVITPTPTRSVPSAAAAAITASAPAPQQVAAQLTPLTVQVPGQAQAGQMQAGQLQGGQLQAGQSHIGHLAGGQLANLPSSQMPTHGRSQSLSHILAQPQSLPQLQAIHSHQQPHAQSHVLSQPQQLSTAHLPAQLQAHSQLLLQSQSLLQQQASQQSQSPASLHAQAAPPAQLQQQLQQRLQSQAAQLQLQLQQQQLQVQHPSMLQPQSQPPASVPQQQQLQNGSSQLQSQLQHQLRAAFDSGADLASLQQPHLQSHLQAGSGQPLAGPANLLSQRVPVPATLAQNGIAPHHAQTQEAAQLNELAGKQPSELPLHTMQSAPQLKPHMDSWHMQTGISHLVDNSAGHIQEGRPPDNNMT